MAKNGFPRNHRKKPKLFDSIFSAFISGLLALTISTNTVNADSAQKKTTVHIAAHIEGGNHRKHFKQLVQNFNLSNPNINIRSSIYQGDEYFVRFSEWIKTGKGPDIALHLSGRRMEYFVDKNALHNLESFWEKNKLTQAFPKTISDSVIIDGKPYGIPISFYVFGLYVNTELLSKYSLDVPADWEQLIQACKTLRQKNIDLFAMGTRIPWVTHGWFDHLNLRINGLEFHKALLSGSIPFTHERVRVTMAHWKELLENKCFNENYASYSRYEAFPRIVHNKSAIQLIDGLPPNFDESTLDDIQLISFPRIIHDIPPYTVSPINAFVVPAYTKMSPAIETTLEYISSIEFQTLFNASRNRLPARYTSTDTQKETKFRKKSLEIMEESPGGIQYFDRDTDIRFSQKTPKIFVDFLKHKDIDKTLHELENLRRKALVFR